MGDVNVMQEEKPGEGDVETINLRLLGGFRLETDGRCHRISEVGQRLLATLALRGRMTRIALAGALWPVATEKHAQGSLRTLLWRLRKSDVRCVEVVEQVVALAKCVDVDVNDVVKVSNRVIAARIGALESADVFEVLRWRDELLPGWYDDSVIFERERLRQLRMHALESAAVPLRAAGRYSAAIKVAWDAIQLDPLRESAHRVLIEIHLVEGNVIEARRQFDRFRSLLDRELGAHPSPRLRELLASAFPDLPDSSWVTTRVTPR